MLDRSHAESVIYRAAMTALIYYPTKHIDEPGYTIDEDIDWCMVPLLELPASTRMELREHVRRIIENPTERRQAFIRLLMDRVTSP